MIESALYPEIKRAFESLDCAVSKIPGSTYNQGLPDYICTWKKRPVHCEVKIVTAKRVGKVTELQRAHLMRHNAAGAICVELTYYETEKLWRAVSVFHQVPVLGVSPTYAAPRRELATMLRIILEDGK